MLDRSRALHARAAAIACIVLLLGACTQEPHKGHSSTPAHPTPDKGGHVSFGVLGAPATLDPYGRTASDLTWELVQPLYPQLFSLQPDGSARQSLAASLTHSSGRTIVRLRRWRWSNGRPISATDVAKSIRRARRPSGFTKVAGVSVRGPRTVVLTGTVSPVDLGTIAFVLPRGRASSVHGTFGGPFLLRRYVPGLRLDYVRNPRWAGHPAWLRRVTVFSVASTAELLALIERHRLDGADIPSALNLGDRLRATGVDQRSVLGWSSIRLDLSPISGKGTRLAIAASIDRATIAQGLIRQDGRITGTLDPAPGKGGAEGRWSTTPRSSASLKGRSIRLGFPIGDELLTQIARVIQRNLQAAGAHVDLLGIEPHIFYGRWVHGGPANVLVERVAGSPSFSTSTKVARRMRAFPMFQVANYVAFRPFVHGVKANGTVAGALWNVQDWWRSRS